MRYESCSRWVSSALVGRVGRSRSLNRVFCLFAVLLAAFDGNVFLSLGGRPLFFGNAWFALDARMTSVGGPLFNLGGRPLFFAGGLTSSIAGTVAADDVVPACKEDMVLGADEAMVAADVSLGVFGGRPLFFGIGVATSVAGFVAGEDMILVSELLIGELNTIPADEEDTVLVSDEDKFFVCEEEVTSRLTCCKPFFAGVD